MSKQHTPTAPTPWKGTFQFGQTTITDANDKPLLFISGIAVAETVLKAVNNHDRLVEALTNMVAYMEEFCEVPDSDIAFNESKQLLTELKS